MKIDRRCICIDLCFIIFFIKCTSTFIYADDYHIEEFQIEGVKPIKSKYLIPSSGYLLYPVSEINLLPGEVLLRQKIGENTYCIFKGELQNPDFSLNSVLLPNDITLDTAVRTKFYPEPEIVPSMDIESVFFTKYGKIFITGTSKIAYLHNNTWKTIIVNKNPVRAQKKMLYGDIPNYKLAGIVCVAGGGCFMSIGLLLHVIGCIESEGTIHVVSLIPDSGGIGMFIIGMYFFKKAQRRIEEFNKIEEASLIRKLQPTLFAQIQGDKIKVSLKCKF